MNKDSTKVQVSTVFFAGSAKPGVDYTPDAGTVQIFENSATTVIMTVPILDLPWQTETLHFSYDLSDESDGSIVSPSTAQIFIKDNGKELLLFNTHEMKI